jgi:hypothetical protein
MSRGEYEAARIRLQDGLSVCERHGLVTLRGISLGNLVDHARKTGDFEAAQRYAVLALEVAETAGYRALASGLKLDLVHIALERGDLEGARTALSEGMKIAIAIGRPTLQVGGVAWFAELLAAQGEVDCACRVLPFASNHPSTNAPEKEEYRARLVQWGARDENDLPNELDFDDLVHRIASEAEVDYAPLIGALRTRVERQKRS